MIVTVLRAYGKEVPEIHCVLDDYQKIKGFIMDVNRSTHM
jgi:hypothetical protein